MKSFTPRYALWILPNALLVSDTNLIRHDCVGGPMDER